MEEELFRTHPALAILVGSWRRSSVGQSMRLISAESGVRVSAPPPSDCSAIRGSAPEVANILQTNDEYLRFD
jgi:hypothetical protein